MPQPETKPLFEFYLPAVRRDSTPTFYWTIAAIVKDEADYLVEWLEFHRLVGCEHFYLYDNGSSDRTGQVIAEYQQRGLATGMPWPTFFKGASAQVAAYAHAIVAYGPQSRWMSFIDIDEFLFSPNTDTLPEELEKYEAYPCLAIPWHMFGFSGHQMPPPGLVTENFKKRSIIPNPAASDAVVKTLVHTKCIVDPTRVRRARVHKFLTDTGSVMYTPRKEPWSRSEWRPSEADPIVLNHYYSRSRDEFERKLQKGLNYGKLNKDANMLVEHRRAVMAAIEANCIEDLRIQRHVTRLKAAHEHCIGAPSG